MMKLEHRFDINATADEVWATFEDLPQVAGCLPGVVIDSTDGDTLSGTCRIKVGPISMQIAGQGVVKRTGGPDPALNIVASGRDRHGAGQVSADITLSLIDKGTGTVTVTVETELAISGRIAQFGRGMITDISDRMFGQFSAALGDLIRRRGEPSGPQSVAAATAETLDVGSTVLTAAWIRLAPAVLVLVLLLVIGLGRRRRRT